MGNDYKCEAVRKYRRQLDLFVESPHRAPEDNQWWEGAKAWKELEKRGGKQGTRADLQRYMRGHGSSDAPFQRKRDRYQKRALECIDEALASYKKQLESLTRKEGEDDFKEWIHQVAKRFKLRRSVIKDKSVRSSTGDKITTHLRSTAWLRP
jgi:hypothetical protein